MDISAVYGSMKYGRSIARIKRQFTAIYDSKLYETKAYVIVFGFYGDRNGRPGWLCLPWQVFLKKSMQRKSFSAHFIPIDQYQYDYQVQ